MPLLKLRLWFQAPPLEGTIHAAMDAEGAPWSRAVQTTLSATHLLVGGVNHFCGQLQRKIIALGGCFSPANQRRPFTCSFI